MIPFLADIDPVFKVLAPRPADWLSILPEIAVAGLSLLCLLQAMFLPKALRSLIPMTARTGLILVALMALTTGPWAQSADVASFAGLLRQNLPTDGVRMGALLDRNGLRPGRYYVTKDDLAIVASEAGVLDIAPENILRKGRLQPGKMFLVDTAAGRIIPDEEIKEGLASSAPYSEWLHAGLIAAFLAAADDAA